MHDDLSERYKNTCTEAVLRAVTHNIYNEESKIGMPWENRIVDIIARDTTIMNKLNAKYQQYVIEKKLSAEESKDPLSVKKKFIADLFKEASPLTDGLYIFSFSQEPNRIIMDIYFSELQTLYEKGFLDHPENFVIDDFDLYIPPKIPRDYEGNVVATDPFSYFKNGRSGLYDTLNGNEQLIKEVEGKIKKEIYLKPKDSPFRKLIVDNSNILPLIIARSLNINILVLDRNEQKSLFYPSSDAKEFSQNLMIVLVKLKSSRNPKSRYYELIASLEAQKDQSRLVVTSQAYSEQMINKLNQILTI